MEEGGREREEEGEDEVMKGSEGIRGWREEKRGETGGRKEEGEGVRGGEGKGGGGGRKGGWIINEREQWTVFCQKSEEVRNCVLYMRQTCIFLCVCVCLCVCLFVYATVLT